MHFALRDTSSHGIVEMSLFAASTSALSDSVDDVVDAMMVRCAVVHGAMGNRITKVEG